MLKALELVGFKSFADKTRFEFPSGITAVVGPNGSGKSNVVDAIKWVLGEQSVKSLRGKEMVDVIFNGSAGRPPLNTAEATLIFDNSEHRLAVDTPDVYVTRRVYRSGEAEYLLNRQPCRLRDIRELFAGTGAATEAYSVIEQGKVDVMLQASAKDRRLIFEEAAGISRFKAKKVETLRRLERVDQNLLRLSDIVDEVGNRLRSVRMQATKARRYKEYADRLQELRTQTAQADWRRLGERLKELEAELTTLAIDRDAALNEAQQLENRALAVEAEITELLARQRVCDSRAADNRERVAAREVLLDDQRTRLHEAEAEEVRLLRQLAALRVRAGDSDQQLTDSSVAVEQARQEQQALQESLTAAERELVATENEFRQLRGEFEASRAAAQEAAQAVAACESEAASLAARREASQHAANRRAEELTVLERSKAEAEIEHGSLAEVESQLAASVDRQHTAWLAAQQALVELQSEQRAKLLELSQLRQRHAGATERAALLQELEARQEGLGAGAKTVLASLRTAQQGPLKLVRGMVADLIRVPVELAPAIEAALAEQAQAFVVMPDKEFLDWAQQSSSRLPSRIDFVWARAEEPTVVDGLHGQPGVHGRADGFVEAPADLAPLVRQLLGRTWIVNTLADALRLAEQAPRGVTLATLAGEAVTSEHTLSIGPKLAAAGLISRRSELRALHEQTASLDARIAACQSQVDAAERRLAELAEAERQQAASHQRAADVLVEHRLRVNAAEVRQTQVTDQIARLAAEVGLEEIAVRSADEALQVARTRLDELKRRQANQESGSQSIRSGLRQADDRLAQQQQGATTAKVNLAKCEERLTSLSTRLAQLRRDQLERRRSVEECREQLVRNRQVRRQTEQSLLAAESELAGLYLLRETLAAESKELVAAHERQRTVRTEFQAAAQSSQALARTLEQQRHAQDLAANEVRHERTTLAGRMKDDYQIDLAEIEADVSPEAQRERAEVDQEIAELRRKINHIGTVNLEALAELEELEKRHADLSAQFQDLTQAKDSLLAIINNINADSRRLFVETLQVVTANFQSLFRKLFGGGQADVVLEEGVDVLDSGIEIVARPPGKELRSISLLSGGEKTLTCVALLLAIFQYRPSPFCVLDEVDAALDEANIERFAAVLQEFLAWTQFIIITHSKKTMTCAGTLYGVTMEESGVSKRVSVRFEDVSEDGQIRTAAARMRESA